MEKILSIACVTPAERAGKTMPVEKFLARIIKTFRSNVTANFDQKAPQTGQEEMYGYRPRRLMSCISGGRNDFFSRTQEIAK